MAVRQKRTDIGSAIAVIAAASLFALCFEARAQEASAVAPKGSDPGGEAGKASPEQEPTVDQTRDTSLVASIVLKVVHPEDVRGSLIELAESLDGFAVLITDERLTLKVPPSKLSQMIQAAAKEGSVVEKTLERQDLTARIAELEGQVKSKTEILRRLRDFFKDSEISAALRVEQSMTALVVELERVKGELRVARERARHAVVDISFRFPERDRIIYVDSPFEWINTVDLDRFLREF